jgi:hypothetical protein
VDHRTRIRSVASLDTDTFPAVTGRVQALKERAQLLRMLAGAASGIRGAGRALRVAAVRRSRTPEPRDPVQVPMRALDGQALWVRPGSSDLVNAASYYSTGAYLPPDEIDLAGAKTICELGTNIGAALTALGVKSPNARLLGVEVEAGNAAVARRNLARFGERATLVERAIWSTETDLVVDRGSTHGEHGFLVRPRGSDDPPEMPSLPATTIDHLLEKEFPDGEQVDYMHVSIEGSEPEALKTAREWPKRVRSLRIELHPYFDIDRVEFISRLEELGYRTWVAPHPPDKWVFAVRR